MKTLQKFVCGLVIITLFASCQTNNDINTMMSKSEIRKTIMDTIANNLVMSQEMIAAMMNSKTARMMILENDDVVMMMIENHEPMMKMMKDHPEMMQNMMSDMLETCSNDSVLMSGIRETMMGNQQ